MTNIMLLIATLLARIRKPFAMVPLRIFPV